MGKMLSLILGVLICTSFSSAEKVRYDNYTLYRLTPTNDRALTNLKNISNSGYDFWSSIGTVGSSVEVLVPPRQKDDLKTVLQGSGIDSVVLLENIQEEIDRQASSISGAFDLSKYNNHSQINSFLRSLAQRYPKEVTVIKGGSSFENRDILGVKVSFNSRNENNAVFIDANLHPREWITGAVSLIILNELLENEDKQIRKVAESHDWYIFPVANPDGYEYTISHDRLWRKTRTAYPGNCFGADANRNWDFKWTNEGTSENPCNTHYVGPHAFSERSITTFSEYISTIASKLKVYISLHSYTQKILLPYGYTKEHLDNYNLTYPVAVKAAEAAGKRYKTNFGAQTMAESAGITPGTSLDWIKGVHKVPFAAIYDLRDKGNYGYILPAEQIVPSGLETLDSIVTFVDEADKVLNN